MNHDTYLKIVFKRTAGDRHKRTKYFKLADCYAYADIVAAMLTHLHGNYPKAEVISITTEVLDVADWS